MALRFQLLSNNNGFIFRCTFMFHLPYWYLTWWGITIMRLDIPQRARRNMIQKLRQYPRHREHPDYGQYDNPCHGDVFGNILALKFVVCYPSSDTLLPSDSSSKYLTRCMIWSITHPRELLSGVLLLIVVISVCHRLGLHVEKVSYSNDNGPSHRVHLVHGAFLLNNKKNPDQLETCCHAPACCYLEAKSDRGRWFQVPFRHVPDWNFVALKRSVPPSPSSNLTAAHPIVHASVRLCVLTCFRLHHLVVAASLVAFIGAFLIPLT